METNIIHAREAEIARDVFNVISSREDAYAGFVSALEANTDGGVALGVAFREWMESMGAPVVVMELVVVGFVGWVGGGVGCVVWPPLVPLH